MAMSKKAFSSPPGILYFPFVIAFLNNSPNEQVMVYVIASDKNNFLPHWTTIIFCHTGMDNNYFFVTQEWTKIIFCHTGTKTILCKRDSQF